MTYNSILKIKELDLKIAELEKNIKSYLSEKNYELDNRKLRELVQWSHTIKNQQVVRMIFPNEHCPDDVKSIVRGFIKDEFKSE
ncbi:hypothetical protein TPENAI_60157 [Tenacibaculum litopenaei]|jgi:hypothetical protein|uniref:hypothetical protein n=1 Tax=Tenacibaculum litopenaei TaxID=396016 RepID=UPI00389327B5